MNRPQSRKPIGNRKESANSLTDADITTIRVDRRSFLSRAVAAGSIAVGVAATTGCPGGTDSDGGGDTGESESEGATQESESEDTAEATDTDSGSE